MLEYLSIRNRAAVFLADSYRYEEACEMMKKNVAQLEKIKDTYKKAAQDLEMEVADCCQVTDLARSYSALGQYMTFLRLWDSENDILLQGDPEAAFLKAIQEFGHRPLTRILLTLICSIMQFRERMKKKQIFEKYRKAYFGEKEISLNR